jgi:signal recognition particle subunit SRP54
MENILGLLPGMQAQMKMIKNIGGVNEELKRVEAIINSMTVRERRDFRIINGSRRIRIARGSGTTVGQVNRVLKSYLEMKKLMKKINHRQIMSLLGQSLKGG